MQPILQEDLQFSIRFYLYTKAWWSEPIICKTPKKLIGIVEDAMGESDVNDDIYRWAQTASVGDIWDEDDLYIVVI